MTGKMAGESSTPVTDTSPHLTIRLIMQGKEVGSIIGKKGDIVKKFREESGAKINISDGSSPERIVTIVGTKDSIYKAFKLICNKFEEDLNSLLSPGTVPRPPISFKLVVPASQCGSLIGKGGSKIKEIREVTGASVQVASEMLANSTERTVTVSGSSDCVTQCIFQICAIMVESPPKGVTVPYTPLKTISPPSAAAVPNIQALVHHPAQAIVPSPPLPSQVQHNKVGIPVSLGSPGVGGGLINPATLALLAAPVRAPPSPHQTHEMTVPNELIGCIIGKGGSKVAEIRQLSGAMIRISNCEDKDAPANLDRTITISGNCESVALAQYLINMSMEVFRVNLALAEEAEKAANNNLPLQAVSPHHPALSPPCLTTDQLTGSGAMLPNQTYQLLAHHHPAASAHQQGCHPTHPGQGCQPNHQQFVDASMYNHVMRLPSYEQYIVPTSKLKASPCLISIPGIRDQKFMPY